MEYELRTKHILHQLGTGKRYSGYDYIICGVKLISQNEMLMSDITKILYADIAKEFHTTSSCVEKNIRKAIEAIWKRVDDKNLSLLTAIFGDGYTTKKPTNKVFLELLYEYVKQHSLLQDLLATGCKCPLCNENCVVYNEIVHRLLD